MNSLTIVVLVVTVAYASASLGHGHISGLGDAAVLQGPSGTVVRSGVAAAPAISVGLGHGGVIAANGLGLGVGALGLGGLGLGGLGVGGLGLGLAGHGAILAAPGSGLEGQWIPDINEHLHDDGSYKPHVYGH